MKADQIERLLQKDAARRASKAPEKPQEGRKAAVAVPTPSELAGHREAASCRCPLCRIWLQGIKGGTLWRRGPTELTGWLA